MKSEFKGLLDVMEESVVKTIDTDLESAGRGESLTLVALPIYGVRKRNGRGVRGFASLSSTAHDGESGKEEKMCKRFSSEKG